MIIVGKPKHNLLYYVVPEDIYRTLVYVALFILGAYFGPKIIHSFKKDFKPAGTISVEWK